MKTIFRGRTALAVLSIIFTFVNAGKAGPSLDARSWQAGVAEIDITPPIGFRMAGYFDERFSTGTHDPLKAKAIVLRQGNTDVALVFCDLVGISLKVTQPARSRASRKTGIPMTNIVIAATHSHTGPLFDDVRDDYFHKLAIKKRGSDPHEKIDYPKFLTDQLVKVIVAAKANLKLAALEAGIATQKGLPFNRRYHMRDGSVATNPGKLNTNIVKVAGPVDSDVGILMVKNRKNEAPIGGLTVFAMHADTVGGTEFSADFPYFIQQALRQAFGSNYISAFASGTAGDLNHIDVSKPGLLRGFPITKGFGDRIAATVLADLPKLHPINEPALAVKDKILNLPLQTTTPREVIEARVIFDRMADPHVGLFLKARAVKAVDLNRLGTNRPAEIQVIRLDSDTAIVCLPAEIFVELGLAIKAASPFKYTMVISICNDRPGYVPTLKAFHEGSYEIINSRWAPGGGEKMVEAAIKMLNELKREP